MSKLHVIDQALELEMLEGKRERFPVIVNLHQATSVLFFPALKTMGLTIEEIRDGFLAYGELNASNINLLAGVPVIAKINLNQIAQSPHKPSMRRRKKWRQK